MNNKPFPIPLENDYLAASEIVEMKFAQHGGLWNKYYTDAYIRSGERKELMTLFEYMWSTSKLIEPIVDDDFSPEDTLYRATDAFRAGMYSGDLIAHEVFAGTMNYDSIHDSINNSLPHPVYEGKEQYDENGSFLMRLGYQGLHTVGSETLTHLEAWSTEVVFEPSVRQTYSLGAGAILAMYHEKYTVMYPMLMDLHRTSQLDLQVSKLLEYDGIEKYLSDNTGSSGN
jgi:hypothetical protein